MKCAAGTREYYARRPARKLNKNVMPSLERNYFATCHPGLEQLVASELESLGAINVETGSSGVEFQGTPTTALKANLWSRCSVRILEHLSTGTLSKGRNAGDELYDFVRESVDWEYLLAPGQTFLIDTRLRSCTNLTNSHFVMIRAKDAICDAMRDARGIKPMPPPSGKHPHLPVFISAFKDVVKIYRDMSGASLHRRGYRSAMHKASLNECAAAGILYLTKFMEQPTRLIDPMCGSGTLLIEAALMATNTAPGLGRQSWPFLEWPDARDFATKEWKKLTEEAIDSRNPQKVKENYEFFGNEIHPGALSLAVRDSEIAGVDSFINFHHGPCETWKLPSDIVKGRRQMIVSNPPWGGRLGNEGDDEPALESWRELQQFLKGGQCAHAEVFLLSGNPTVTQGLRMKAEQKYPLVIGGVDCRLLKYIVLPPLTKPV